MLLRLPAFLIALAFAALTHAYAGPLEDTVPANEPVNTGQILTRDPLRVVFSYLDVEAASKVRSVCREWKKVADNIIVTNNPYFYKTADLDNFFFHNNFPQEQLGTILSNPNKNITRRFWERLECFGKVLWGNRKALTALKNTNFVRLLNLAAFQTIPNFHPFRKQEADEIATFIQMRRYTISKWKDSIQKAQAYATLCSFSKDPIDHETMYELNMQIKPSEAKQILRTHVTDAESARIMEIYQRKVWNTAPRVEPQQPIIIRVMNAAGSVIGFVTSFF